ncbi:woronin body major [Fusarium globosum]|uniref:Woronin body major n=1 Tax=Fusarium globosum TaxID=78864 RepID=A0A8H5XW07_9HYPO|nr:woronin body major [Fusarium globosum]
MDSRNKGKEHAQNDDTDPTLPELSAEYPTSEVAESSEKDQAEDGLDLGSLTVKTGQYFYEGCDLFDRRLYTGYSFIWSPAPRIAVQSMLGPVFKQYRVLRLEHGMAVISGEKEGEYPGVKILQNQSLYSRIENALNSNRGFVIVVVLEHEHEKLAVDLKVIDTSSPDVKTEESLHAAVRGKSDSEFEIQLFQFAERHSDIDQLDQSGKTALDVAVSMPQWYDRALMLLKAGASPTAQLEEPFISLLNAAAEGSIEKLEQLFRNNVKLNRRDRLGYTALHEAVYFGHFSAVEFLVANGANVNAIVTYGGDTVLHVAVQRGLQHRYYLDDARAQSPRLSQDHIKIIGFLVRHGADTKMRRKRGHLTAAELVSQELRRPKKYQPDEICYLQRILIMLSTTSYSQQTEEVPGGELTVDDELIKLRGEFRNSSCKSSYFEMPVADLLISSRNDLNRIIRQHREDVYDSTSKINWVWVHLPANLVCLQSHPGHDYIGLSANDSKKDWVEDAIYKLTYTEKTVLKEYYHAVQRFISESFNEVRGPIAGSHSRKPCFHPQPGSHNEIFSLVVPYLDAENLYCLHNLERVSVHGGYLRRSSERGAIGQYKRSKLIMVKQIWIWKVDDNLSGQDLKENQDIPKRREEAMKRIQREICDITKESGDLLQIKDVRHALTMICGVLDSQWMSIKEYADQRILAIEEIINGIEEAMKDEEESMNGNEEKLQRDRDILHDEWAELENAIDNVKSQLSKVNSLIKNAFSVEESIKNLLDLKQKQGSLMAVRDTQSLTRTADSRAREGERQSQLLLIFTIITVFFTPVSFTSAFMAIPTKDFPHNGEGEVSWGWVQVFLASLIAELFTLLCVSPWIFSELRLWYHRSGTESWIALLKWKNKDKKRRDSEARAGGVH